MLKAVYVVGLAHPVKPAFAIGARPAGHDLLAGHPVAHLKGAVISRPHLGHPADELVPRDTGRLYIPADFDTIEKAFSGVETAEKGIK